MVNVMPHGRALLERPSTTELFLFLVYTWIENWSTVLATNRWGYKGEADEALVENGQSDVMTQKNSLSA